MVSCAGRDGAEHKNERFELEGVTYYQQGRKCGKAGCRCTQGKLHGPYWYAREQASGKVQYLGKELPAPVASARQWHEVLLSEMLRRRREFTEKARVLARLIGHTPLSEADRAVIVELGLGDALVSEPALAPTQDGDAR